MVSSHSLRGLRTLGGSGSSATRKASSRGLGVSGASSSLDSPGIESPRLAPVQGPPGSHVKRGPSPALGELGLLNEI